MTLPNFLVIGAMKAGTTTIYDYLRQHPSVYMTYPIKEPKYFCVGGEGKNFYIPVKSFEKYEALFNEVEGETAIGEASANYLAFPPAAQKIRDTLPDVRLIASLRDPVERAYSLYQMNLRNTDHNRDVPFLDALKRDHWLSQGYYENIKRFHTVFGRDRVRVILFDDLVAQPVRTMRALFAFLDVDPGFDLKITGISNPGGVPRFKVLHHLLASKTSKEFGRRYLPDALVEGVKRIRNRNLRKQGITQTERAAAAAHFRDDTLRTQDLIGTDLGRWLTRDAAEGPLPPAAPVRADLSAGER